MRDMLCGTPLCETYDGQWMPSLVKRSRRQQLSYFVITTARCYLHDELEVAAA